jgi:transcriptional regulator NrdR family protein
VDSYSPSDGRGRTVKIRLTSAAWFYAEAVRAGEQALRQLRTIDKVAYVRFASVLGCGAE